MTLVLPDRALVLLDEQSIERIKRQDPFELDLSALPPGMKAIAVSFVGAADDAHVSALFDARDAEAIIAFAFRGYEFRPDLGDGEPYVEVKK